MLTYIIPAAAIATAIALLVLKRGKKAVEMLQAMCGGNSLMNRDGKNVLPAEKGKSLKPQLAKHGINLAANFAHGGKRCDQILAEQVPLMLKAKQRVAFMEGGWNDILQGRAIEDILRDIAATDKALMDAGITVIRYLPHYGKHPDHARLNAHVDAISNNYKRPWCIDLRQEQFKLMPLPDGLHWVDDPDRERLAVLGVRKCRELGVL